MTTIALSLISHTNAGKTTLARTLVGRDVGEVRDAPHVTLEAAAYPLIDTPDRPIDIERSPHSAPPTAAASSNETCLMSPSRS